MHSTLLTLSSPSPHPTPPVNISIQTTCFTITANIGIGHAFRPSCLSQAYLVSPPHRVGAAAKATSSPTMSLPNISDPGVFSFHRSLPSPCNHPYQFCSTLGRLRFSCVFGAHDVPLQLHHSCPHLPILTAGVDRNRRHVYTLGMPENLDAWSLLTRRKRWGP